MKFCVCQYRGNLAGELNELFSLQFRSSLPSSQSRCSSQRWAFGMQNGRRPANGLDAWPLVHLKSDERHAVDAFH